MPRDLGSGPEPILGKGSRDLDEGLPGTSGPAPDRLRIGSGSAPGSAPGAISEPTRSRGPEFDPASVTRWRHGKLNCGRVRVSGGGLMPPDKLERPHQKRGRPLGWRAAFSLFCGEVNAVCSHPPLVTPTTLTDPVIQAHRCALSAHHFNMHLAALSELGTVSRMQERPGVTHIPVGESERREGG